MAMRRLCMDGGRCCEGRKRARLDSEMGLLMAC
jgi:hypothetical protein